jgi:tryptophan halogenase
VKNIIIVGGGTSGWITALYAQKIFPEENITLIESDDIGILGAGEGSTPGIIDFLDFINIPISELIENTKTTIKNGIKFTNWDKDGNYYYHGFDINAYQLSENFLDSNFNRHYIEQIPISRFSNYINNDKPYLGLCGLTSEKNKVLFKIKESPNLNINPIIDFDQYGAYSIHFDATRLANYFSQIAQSRGVKRIEGIIQDVDFDNDGNICKVKLKNNTNLNVDFLFDCTGFARFFIGKQFKSDWITFKEYLPMKKAVPFFLDIDNKNIPPYTESIAMEYGWMWKIPLQHRYGCGYVFDSDFIDEDQAKDEIEKFLGQKITSPKTFSFEPGCYKDVWIKNCMSVGLASSFVEPLEATSIWQIITQLRNFFSKKENIFNRDEEIISYFNKNYLKETTEISYFIYLHYITNKNNTDFWNSFIKNNPMPEKIYQIIQKLKKSILIDQDVDSLFIKDSYYQVADGLKILNKDHIKNIYNTNNLHIYNNIINKQEEINKITSNTFVNHSDFLKHLGGLL